MNREEDGLMILCKTGYFGWISSCRAQPFGCQIKAPVSMTKWKPFHSSSSHPALQSPSGMHVYVCGFFFFPFSSPPPNLLYTMDFGGRLSVLFALNFFRRLRRASSPWIFILPLTPLNVNSSFPLLLFISGIGWFDHAGNTRLAIASSLLSPPRTSAPEMLLFVLLNPLRPTFFLTFDIFFPSFPHRRFRASSFLRLLLILPTSRCLSFRCATWEQSQNYQRAGCIIRRGIKATFSLRCMFSLCWSFCLWTLARYVMNSQNVTEWNVAAGCQQPI